MKIIDSVWFDKIGIVKVDTGYETKWYIGIGKGNNKEIDEKTIVYAGTQIVPRVLQGFFKSVKEQQKEDELEEIKMQHLKEIEEQIKKNQEK
jgi:hypothetical protein